MESSSSSACSACSTIHLCWAAGSQRAPLECSRYSVQPDWHPLLELDRDGELSPSMASNDAIAESLSSINDGGSGDLSAPDLSHCSSLGELR
jgi:hypothetical protein